MSIPLLNIENLQVAIHEATGNNNIINQVSLSIAPGEVHALMGPNGSGKSTLAKAITGHPDCITSGTIEFAGTAINALSPEERAKLGIFMSFQQPVALEGVANSQFLKSCVNAKRVAAGQAPLDAVDFLQHARAVMSKLNMDSDLLQRAVNDGFSGGEKKANEILQLSLLQPRLAILDEIDSGLDIDALKMVSAGINALRNPERSWLIVTHYQRILDYVIPDKVHVILDGSIVRTGNKNLPHELEQSGYQWLTANA